MSDTLESLVRLAPTNNTNDANDARWIGSLRRQGLENFLEHGLPTRRLEAWKGTNFAPLGAMHFTRVGPGDGPKAAAAKLPVDSEIGGIVEGDVENETATDGYDLVFVDGRFDADASRRSNLPAGIRALTMAEVLKNEPDLLEGKLGQLTDLKRQPLVALQTAFLEDGLVLVLDPGSRTTRPLRFRFVSTDGNTNDAGSGTGGRKDTKASGAGAAFPRMLVIAAENSEATLLHEHVADGVMPGFTAFVAEFFLAEGARVESVQIQAEGTQRIHFTSVHAHVARSARFHSHVFSLGSGLVRSEIEVCLTEPGAETILCGLFVGREKGHIDHFTTVDHAAEQCTSDEEYRGVLGDHSEGVFRGLVIIRPGAQKSDARQSNPNLLLSDHASINTKPQLEIYADDVRANHGSTIGQLDSDALFYLLSRGLDITQARLLLTGAFAQSTVNRIANDALRLTVKSNVDAALRRLEHGMNGANDSSEHFDERADL